MKKGRTKVCPGGGKGPSEEGTCEQRGKTCVESFRREVWKGRSVPDRDSGLAES